jgi:hypothetical protein
VSHGLNAEHVLAFGIDLQSQVAAVQFENGQIIRRSLDRDFPLGSFALVVFRAVPISEDGLDGLEIQGRPAAVNQRLKHLLHLTTQVKHQVAAVMCPLKICGDLAGEADSDWRSPDGRAHLCYRVD